MSSFRLLALGTSLLVACTSAPPVRKPRDTADGRRVTAIGVVTGIESLFLARQVAQRRAVSSLVRLLTPDAVSFTYERAGDHSVLGTRVRTSSAPIADTLFESIANGWLARATATRTPQAAAAIAALPTVRVVQEVRHADVALALLTAESRAVRAAVERAIAASAPKAEKAGISATGTLTLAALKQEVRRGGARVALDLHVRLAEHGPLRTERVQAVLDRAATEHAALGEWERAAAAANAAIAAARPTPQRWGALGEILLEAGKPRRAARAFLQAASLSSRKPHYFDRARVAAKRAKDAALVAEIEQRRRDVEKEGGAK